MKRVTGIGGVFFKSTDPKRLAEWYRVHLGFKVEDWGASLSNGPARIARQAREQRCGVRSRKTATTSRQAAPLS